MKKTIFIVLLCFVVVLAMSAIDMSPHPGDSIESVFIVQDVVVISQAVSAPADILYQEQINIYNSNEICLSANEEMIGTTNDIFNSGITADIAVAYIGFEMGYDNLYKPGEDVAIYCMEYG